MEHHWKRSRVQGPATACATAIASTIETATAMRTATLNKKGDDVSCESNDGSDANDDGDKKPWRQSLRQPSIRRKTHDVSRVERRAENDVSEKNVVKQRCFRKRCRGPNNDVSRNGRRITEMLPLAQPTGHGPSGAAARRGNTGGARRNARTEGRGRVTQP